MKAVVLAGGCGNRLKQVVKNIPKPMASVGQRPFLERLLVNLKGNGVEEVILAVGYLKEIIIEHFGYAWGGLTIDYAIECYPLGTGGAIKHAFRKITNNNFALVLNGDTWIEFDLAKMIKSHQQSKADITIIVRTVSEADRYGTIQIENNKIVSFVEKGIPGKGIINAGVYLLRPGIFSEFNLPEVFSFEKDFLARYVSKLQLNPFLSRGRFIDIGTPEDYFRSQSFFCN